MQFKLLLVSALAGLVSAQAAASGGSPTSAATLPTGTSDLMITLGNGGVLPSAAAGQSLDVTYKANPTGGEVKFFFVYGDSGDLQQWSDTPACTGPATGTSCQIVWPKAPKANMAIEISQGKETNYSGMFKIEGGDDSNPAPAAAKGSSASASGSATGTATGTETAEPSATGSGSAMNTLETVTGSTEPSASASASASATNSAVATETEASKTSSSSAAKSSTAGAAANIQFSAVTLFGGLFAAFLAL